MSDNAMIKVNDLKIHYDNGRIKALDGITTEISKGEVVVVVGPSGSGKSTFLRSLNLLETPTEGSICFEGVNITDPDVDINKHRQKMGMVFQQFNLFPHMNILKNMTLAPMKLLKMEKSEAEEKALSLLEKVGLKERMDHLPQALSGGQQQRVAVARAIAAAPPVILADEPTGNLDTRSTKDVMKILHQLKDEGRTVIVITHDNEIAMEAERVVRIRDGRIVEDYINPGFEEKYGRKAKYDNANPIDLG